MKPSNIHSKIYKAHRNRLKSLVLVIERIISKLLAIYKHPPAKRHGLGLERIGSR
jgi:hypothetical protein